MTSKVHRTPQAQSDLLDVWLYIAADNEAAADKLLDRVDHILAMLGDNPNAGRARPDLIAGIRSFPIGNYILFYRPVQDGIELVRFLSARLDIDADDVS